LCGWFHKLQNCCSDVEVLVVGLAEVGLHMAQVLVVALVYLACGMLFVVVAETRLLTAELYEFGLW
jgi:hypothetical protein